MKIFYFIFSCILVVGCHLGELEDELVGVDENTTSIVSVSNNQEICEVCNAFNAAFKNYKSTLKEGLEKYKKAGGCCEDCFKADVSFWYGLYNTLYSDEILTMLEVIEKNGYPMECPMCEAFADKQMGIINALRVWPSSFYKTVVIDVVDIAGRRQCTNVKPGESGKEDDEENVVPPASLPYIKDLYQMALEIRTSLLLEKVGGDVEEYWQGYGLEPNLLRLCYALNQDEAINLDREGVTHVHGGMLGGDGSLYLTTFYDLYWYLCSYESPQLVTKTELQGKMGIIIAKRDVDAGNDVVEGFGDICENGRFLSGETTNATEFYLWEY